MTETVYTGLLVIGDPHLEGRQPGFRKDDYPNVILQKLEWCLDYARNHRLLPAILGDLFDKPRDNPTWMLVRLIEMLDLDVIGLYGNHDCADPELNDNDSLSLLIKSGRLRLVTEDSPWQGSIQGRNVIIGGSSYRRPIPQSFPAAGEPFDSALVIWLTHHDILVPGYEELGRVKPRAIDRIDIVINGHIHRRLPEVRVGDTLWLTPGNISRRTRSDATREHRPAVLRIDIAQQGHQRQFIEVPHRPFEEVFHDPVVDQAADTRASAFVAGLAELQARRTASGAGLMEFLEKNLIEFDPAVAAEILELAKEVSEHGQASS